MDQTQTKNSSYQLLVNKKIDVQHQDIYQLEDKSEVTAVATFRA